VQLVRELPGGEFGDISVVRHAEASSNRIADVVSANSGLIADHRTSRVAESAMRIGAAR
jgi:hypothetical protein